MTDEFDFESHKQTAINEYTKIRPLYGEFSGIVKSILEKCLGEKSIKYQSLEARAKSVKSFGLKASLPSEDNPNKPKYLNPIKEINDMAGVRIITFFLKTLNEIDKVIFDEFEVLEKSDKIALLKQQEMLGYQGVHYLIKLKEPRSTLPEYKKYAGLIVEVQARTILQHAWDEIEHDIQYKSVLTIPISIKRRFMALAGLLEIADREFQTIQDQDLALRMEARKLVKEGRLENVEITPDALKEYLDKKLGLDGRMTDFSYSWEAKILIKMGFTNFEQIDKCVKDYDDDEINGILYGTRQGQLTRFESLLLAGMGENYSLRHPWGKEEWWLNYWSKRLDKLRTHGIEIGNYSADTNSK
jgi:putative GTP pyrophosphokinase